MNNKAIIKDEYVYKYQAALKIVGDACVDVIELQRMDFNKSNALMQAYVDLVYCAIAEIGPAVDSFFQVEND